MEISPITKRVWLCKAFRICSRWRNCHYLFCSNFRISCWEIEWKRSIFPLRKIGPGSSRVIMFSNIKSWGFLPSESGFLLGYFSSCWRNRGWCKLEVARSIQQPDFINERTLWDVYCLRSQRRNFRSGSLL